MSNILVIFTALIAFLHFQMKQFTSESHSQVNFLLFIYFSPVSLPDFILSLTFFSQHLFKFSKKQTLGHSQVWAISLGQEGVVRVEVVGGILVLLFFHFRSG